MDQQTASGAARRCPYCGAENRIGASVCPGCGQALPAPRARASASPSYAIPDQIRLQQARLAAHGAFIVQSGGPPSLDCGMEPAAATKRPASASPSAASAPIAAGAAALETETAHRQPCEPVPDPAGRRAPYFDPSAFDPAYAAPAEPDAEPARPGARRILLPGLLAGLLGTGLLGGAAFWWLHQPDGAEWLANHGPARPQAAAAIPSMPALAPAPAPESAPAAIPAPIAAGELPYDGLPPAPPTPAVKPEAPPAEVPAAMPPTSAEAPRSARATAAPSRPAKPPGKPRRAGSPPPAERSLTPLMLAQCQSMANPAERAQCRLEVCRGKTGKNACPS